MHKKRRVPVRSERSATSWTAFLERNQRLATALDASAFVHLARVARRSGRRCIPIRRGRSQPSRALRAARNPRRTQQRRIHRSRAAEARAGASARKSSTIRARRTRRSTAIRWATPPRAGAGARGRSRGTRDAGRARRQRRVASGSSADHHGHVDRLTIPLVTEPQTRRDLRRSAAAREGDAHARTCSELAQKLLDTNMTQHRAHVERGRPAVHRARVAPARRRQHRTRTGDRRGRHRATTASA